MARKLLKVAIACFFISQILQRSAASSSASLSSSDLKMHDDDEEREQGKETGAILLSESTNGGAMVSLLNNTNEASRVARRLGRSGVPTGKLGKRLRRLPRGRFPSSTAASSDGGSSTSNTAPAPPLPPPDTPPPRPPPSSPKQRSSDSSTAASSKNSGGSGGGAGKDEAWRLRLPRGNLGSAKSPVMALHDVCIEAHPQPWKEVKKGSCPHRPDLTFNINRRIVVYNSRGPLRTAKGLKVGGSGNRKNLWDITYSPDPVPRGRRFAAYPAFFVTTTCEANLHHFLVDEFNRIFTLFKRLKLLDAGNNEAASATAPPFASSGVAVASNESQVHPPHRSVALLYRDDVHSFCRETGCHDPTRFEPFLYALPVRSHRAYFTSQEHLNVCFKDAILGTPDPATSGREVSSFLTSRLMQPQQQQQAETATGSGGGGGGGRMCGATRHPGRTVVLLQRESRRIANMGEIVAAVRQLQVAPSGGEKGALSSTSSAQQLTVKVAVFENASIAEQLATVACCGLLVGVMGAGQQWVSFMPRGSTLLSVGWQNWRADYYETYAKAAGVRFRQISASKVVPNFKHPTVLKLHGEKELASATYRQALVQKADKQIMKYSDVKISPKDVVKVACQAFSCV